MDKENRSIRKRALLVSVPSARDRSAALLKQRALYLKYRPLLRRWGKLEEIAEPSIRLPYACQRARERGDEVWHLCFFPWQIAYLPPDLATVVFLQGGQRLGPTALRDNRIEEISRRVTAIIAADSRVASSLPEEARNLTIHVFPPPRKVSAETVHAWNERLRLPTPDVRRPLAPPARRSPRRLPKAGKIRPLYVEVGPLFLPRFTGIGRFSARLLEALARVVPVQPIKIQNARHWKVGPVLQLPRGDSSPENDLEAWANRYLPRSPQMLEPSQKRDAAAVFTLFGPASREFGREIGIFYDFTPHIIPWAHSTFTRRAFGDYFVRRSSFRDHLIAISRSTKEDAGWWSAVPSSQISVSYPGPSTCVSRHSYSGAVARRKNVILVVSTLEPRKNVPFLLDWFLETAALPRNFELWWVGGRAGWTDDKWARKLLRASFNPRGRRVIFWGRVSDAELCRFYREATFTIYPSLYEGFGFPVLDSLWHGAPVLTSGNSSLAEFTLKGVWPFDPRDSRSLDLACRDLRAARSIAIPRRGLAERFSWREFAKTVVRHCY